MATPTFNPNAPFEDYTPKSEGSSMSQPQAQSEKPKDVPVFDPKAKYEDTRIYEDPLNPGAFINPDAKNPNAHPIKTAISDSAAGTDLGEPLSGRDASWWDNVKKAATAPDAIPDWVPMTSEVRLGLNTASRLLGLQNEAIRGTPLEGAALAFPLGGAEAGMVYTGPKRFAGNPEVQPTRLSPEAEAGYTQVYHNGTAEDIMRYAHDNGFTLDPKKVEDFVKSRDAGAPIADQITYKQQELPLEEQQNLPLNQPTPDEALMKEANAFQSQPEPQIPDMRQRELPLDTPPQQQSLDFGKMSDHVFQKAEPASASGKTPEVVQKGVDRINAVTKDWSNPPTIRVHEDFGKLSKTGIDPDAVAVTQPDNTVDINMKAAAEKAAEDGVSVDDVVTAATYHESLGHYGLSERFGKGLDDFLQGLYDYSPWMKREVDRSIKAAPDVYANEPNQIAAHAEEVLAEMSEKGKIPSPILSKVRDFFKGYGREMGLQLEYSPGELKSIMSQTHNYVTDGNPKLSLRGLPRYMYAGRKAKTADDQPEENWFQGPDGNYRFEINDRNSTLDSDVYKKLHSSSDPKDPYANHGSPTVPLGDLLDHPELYDAYPGLRDVPVKMDDNRSQGGSYNPVDDIITLTRPRSKYMSRTSHSTLLHEIQHAIQERENWSRGGSPTDYLGRPMALKVASEKHLMSTLDNIHEWDKAQFEKHAQELDAIKEAAYLPEAEKARAEYQNLRASGKVRSQLRADLESKGQDPIHVPIYKNIMAKDNALRDRYYKSLDDWRKAIGLEEKPADMSFERKNAYYGLQIDLIENADIERVLSNKEEALVQAYKDIQNDKELIDLGGSRDDYIRAIRRHRQGVDMDRQAYDSLFGEVEARDVQARQNMTDLERSNTRPYSSQDKLAPPDSYIHHTWQEQNHPISQSLGEVNTKEDPAVQATAELLGVPKDRIEKALTEADFKGQVEITRHDLKTGKLVIDPVFGPEYPSRGSRYMRRSVEVKKEMPDTKVVDDEGNPRVLYHGTSKDKGFSKFNVKRRGSWFTSDPRLASSYAEQNDSQGFRNAPTPGNPWNQERTNTASRVAPVYLDIKNPKVYTGTEMAQETYKRGGERYSVGEGKLFDELRSQGYDGVRIKHDDINDTWVVLDSPNQIKSALTSEGKYKYMRRRSLRDGEGTRQGHVNADDRTKDTPRSVIANYTSDRNLKDVMDEVTPEKTRQSWSQWIDDAGSLKNVGKVAQNLATGAEPHELIAAQQYAVRSANLIHDLSRKAVDQTLSPKEEGVLSNEIRRLRNIMNSIDEVKSNAARIMNASKIEVGSDKALPVAYRNMIRNLSDADLNDTTKLHNLATRLSKAGQPAASKAIDALVNIYNIPRTLLSSTDLSAPFRQGLFFAGNKNFYKSLWPMIKFAFSKEHYDNAYRAIENHPDFKYAERYGLEITDMNDNSNLSNREEAFLSNLPQKVPGIGKVVKGSEQAYVGFLNKLRFDVFNDLVARYEKAGIDPRKDPVLMKGITKYVNNATGRGDLGSFTQAAPRLSTVLWSPRLIASRVRMLNPYEYYKMDKVVRRHALENLVKTASLAAGTLYLAKTAGADVETDPRSSDFGKIKVGDTREDILGGFGQFITLYSRILSNSTKNAKGVVKELGKGYGTDNLVDVIAKFSRNKLAPVPGAVLNERIGKDPVGQPYDIRDPKRIAELVAPMVGQDFWDLYKDKGVTGTSVLMAGGGLFGFGLQTYHIDMGYDAYGRDMQKLLRKGGPETDPTVIEVNRLIDGPNNFEGVAPAPKTVTSDGVKYHLTPEQVDEWQKIMGEYQHQYMTEDMNTKDYVMGTDQEKIDILKKSHSDAYKDTKVYFEDNVLNK